MFSTPAYKEINFDPTGRFHLIAGVGSGGLAVARVSAQARAAAAVYRVLYDPDPALNLAEPILASLSQAVMGLRLYLAGPESFLWAATRSGASFGLGMAEMQLELSELCGRDVYCVHCKHVNQQVATALHTCIGCGIVLGVREHFSRRLGCYMGVCAL